MTCSGAAWGRPKAGESPPAGTRCSPRRGSWAGFRQVRARDPRGGDGGRRSGDRGAVVFVRRGDLRAFRAPRRPHGGRAAGGLGVSTTRRTPSGHRLTCSARTAPGWGGSSARRGARRWRRTQRATPLRFQGQYEDAETGLYYNRHRYDDPETGTYLSVDPLGSRVGTCHSGT